MREKDLRTFLVLAVFAVPLQSLQDWTVLSFHKIPANQVKIDQNSLIVKVVQSASPIVYKLPEIKTVSSFSADLTIVGQMNEESKNHQFPEDSYLRFGLVAKGENKLNWFQRKIAARWVLDLFELAPRGVGLDKIYFFNVGTKPEQVGKIRQHPQSDLIVEEIITSAQQPGDFKIQHTLARPLDVVALWISIDGDQSNSTYTSTLKNIKLY